MSPELRLPVLALPGSSSESLGSYLAPLGLPRVLSRKRPSTQIAGRDEVLQVVGGSPTPDELLELDRHRLPAHKIGRWKCKLSEVDEWVRAGGADAHEPKAAPAAKRGGRS